MLDELPAVPKRPTRFPFIDYFSGGDSDLDNVLAAIDAMSRLGLHGISTGTQVRKTPSWPRRWANFSPLFISCIPAGMHGPTWIFGPT
jgi:hypothetical protein